MEGRAGIWGFLLICVVAVVAGTGMGILLGSSDSEPFETVVETVSGGDRTVTETEFKTVTETKTEELPDPEEISDPVLDSTTPTTTDDDTDQDNCSDSYAPVCLDPSDGTNDLSCSDVTEQDFTSTKDDPYGLDGDGNEVACESR